MRVGKGVRRGAEPCTRGRVRSPEFQFFSFSVLTGPSLPSTAARTACQERMAHLTRAGNLCTPANTASLPTLSASPFPVVTRSRTLSKRALTSDLLRPLTASVIKEAEAFEIQQPEP